MQAAWLERQRRETAARTREACEQSLYRFFQEAWSVVDPAPFVGGWHLQAIAEHLEAVTAGHIRKLLINIRPRSSKTTLVSIAWPCWVWAIEGDGSPLRGAGARFLCSSYGANKAQQDGVTARRLIGSQWYQRNWGSRVQIVKDRDNQEQYDTTAGGSRISTGIPESLGKGGIYRVIDDPQKTDEVESATVREGVIRAYREIWSTRENDPNLGAEVIIMQRQAEDDLSGYVLDQWQSDDAVHLCIPAWFEEDRRCVTYVRGEKFWEDPREEEGEPFWPERFGPDQLAKDRALGEFAFAGQIQQRPEPRGGGIIKRHWWMPWPPAGEEDVWLRERVLDDGRKVMRPIWPEFDLVIASVDGAYTSDQANDYCAMTVWGTFTDKLNRPRVMLISAWRERLELHAFVQRIISTCRLRHVDRLLIEGKASGISAAQETRRLMREEEWTIELIEPKGDKVARMLAVQPIFQGGVVHAPYIEPAGYTWVNMVIDEVAAMPNAAHDDLADSCSGALNWLRKHGFARLASEAETDLNDQLLFRGNSPTVADIYGV